MLCPKCYGKLSKDKKKCLYCGFDMTELDGASNKEAKEIKKTIYKDDILYTTSIPADVSKKKLLLFAIFLGLFGVHDFYVGKFWQGFYQCVVTGMVLILGITLSIMNTFVQNAVQITFEFMTVFMGVALIVWVVDIIKICLERFKIPVYKKSFSENLMPYKKDKK